MVELNFQRMQEYFSLSRDFPYRYRIHVKMNGTGKLTSNPHIYYYRISLNDGESFEPEIIFDDPNPEDLDDMLSFIKESYHKNGKESKHASVTSTGFNITVTSTKHGANMPLTNVIYEDFKNEFEELFEKTI